jgi:hypothetical protein
MADWLSPTARKKIKQASRFTETEPRRLFVFALELLSRENCSTVAMNVDE